MESGLEDCYAIVFEHVKELEVLLDVASLICRGDPYCCLSGIIETQEKKFRMLVGQP